MKFIKNILDDVSLRIKSSKEKKQKHFESEFKERFKIKECGGSIYITIDGIAISKISPNEKMENVSLLLSAIRHIALEYINEYKKNKK